MNEPGTRDRLFLAVDLPDSARRSLGRLRTEYPELDRELRWVRPEGIHISLKFLGAATQEQLDGMTRALASAPLTGTFGLTCRGAGVFGPASSPRVLWAGIVGELGPLASLQAGVEELAARLGWERESRPFAPHVTLARSRGRISAQGRSSLGDLLATYRSVRFSSFTVDSMTLYSSSLGPGGSVYTPLYRCPLGG